MSDLDPEWLSKRPLNGPVSSPETVGEKIRVSRELFTMQEPTSSHVPWPIRIATDTSSRLQTYVRYTKTY
ncbi:uncharacterized protein EAE98_008524 [Botrytis deweyae]|uniref:Uncharacterized protein n=1 Tax=Botrytis deweyae TaxID=2478750 RepID=A0ABQ7IEV7_9HELO|nr:uncharacterized protein EAE98_008524 [Botrytis deweyae]KAF7921677.1 hypothetical protein EAE98_008524 [Botrytis deweyae]